MMSRLSAANEVRTGRFAVRVSVCASLLFAIFAVPITAQIPDEFQNLRVLPTDISRDSLLRVTRDFSFALGVRCQYCHVGGDGTAAAIRSYERTLELRPNNQQAAERLRALRAR